MRARLGLTLAAASTLGAQIQEVLEPGSQIWYVAYDDAERALKAGKHREALRNYQRALRLTSTKPGDGVPTYGTRYIRFYPYLGMARAALALGDLATAKLALDQSSAAGGEPAAQREALREALRQELLKHAPKPVEARPTAPPQPIVEHLPALRPAPKPEVREETVQETSPPWETEAPSKPVTPAPAPQPKAIKPKTETIRESPAQASNPPPSVPSAPPQTPARWPWWTAGGLLATAGTWLLWRRKGRNPYGVDLRPPTSGNLRKGSAPASQTMETAVSRTPIPSHLGPFRILELLGRGGCATTYLGIHERTGQKAAIKVPHPHVLADGDFHSRFWREAELGRMLDHPRIPRILEVGSEEDPWLAMAFVPGITLEDHLKRVQPLPLNQAIHIALDVAEALAHAHAKGVVHRDLKPSNVMLGEGGAMVLDFGIARLLDTAHTATALLIGTPAYFAPEGLQSARVGPGADRYALGILLFEMLAGQKPFTGDNPFHVLEQHRTSPLPDLQALRPEAPARLVRLVERLCQKAPAERPEDLEALEILRSLKATHPL